MTAHAPAHDTAHGDHAEHHVHPPSYYVKIWGVLMVLLVISIIGPEIGIKWVTLTTAFGIAVVKAYLVASKFMHLNIEKRYASFLIITAILLMGIFFFGVAGDVMNHDGQRWENQAAKIETARRLQAAEAAGAHGAGHDTHDIKSEKH
jgi:caa(3)-type oxidase subunit IV